MLVRMQSQGPGWPPPPEGQPAPNQSPGQWGAPPAGPGKDRALAVLLALLLGNFGVHRFYLGQIAWGVGYLIFFWTGVPGFIAWLEAIYFLTRSNEDWAATYGGPGKPANGCAIGCLWILALLPLLAIGLIVALIFIGGQVAEILSEIGTEI